jgi:hypothetical protein
MGYIRDDEIEEQKVEKYEDEIYFYVLSQRRSILIDIDNTLFSKKIYFFEIIKCSLGYHPHQGETTASLWKGLKIVLS